MRRILIWGLVLIVSSLGAWGCGGYTRAVVVAEGSTGPSVADIHYRNGVRLYNNGFYDRASVEFQLAIEEDPSLWQAHYYLADCYDELGYYDRCVDQYNVVLDLYHEPIWVARVQYNLGVVYEKQGQYDQARSRYVLALQAKPGFGPAKKNYGRLMSAKFKNKDEVKDDEGRGWGRGRGHGKRGD